MRKAAPSTLFLSCSHTTSDAPLETRSTLRFSVSRRQSAPFPGELASSLWEQQVIIIARDFDCAVLARAHLTQQVRVLRAEAIGSQSSG